MKFLIIIYNDPEWYPPTLNAITVLSKHADAITILGVRNKSSEWQYPLNVTSRYILSQKKLKKIIHFMKALNQLLRNDYDWVICYDDLALLFFYFITFFKKKKPKLWYHNHDVLEQKKVKKYSLNWIVLKLQSRIFKHINLFTLPSDARKKYFPFNCFKGNYYLLPNYAEKTFVNSFKTKTDPQEKKDSSKITLIYQGVINKNHGFEEIIPLLNKTINSKTIHLQLIGPISSSYKKYLLGLAEINNVKKQLEIIPAISYKKLQKYTRDAYIGIAIHNVKNIQYTTGATASNKIYEYLSFGLPILLANTIEYKKLLAKYPWAFFADINSNSIYKQLKNIDANYEVISETASNDFESTFNYEIAFTNILVKEIL